MNSIFLFFMSTCMSITLHAMDSTNQQTSRGYAALFDRTYGNMVVRWNPTKKAWVYAFFNFITRRYEQLPAFAHSIAYRRPTTPSVPHAPTPALVRLALRTADTTPTAAAEIYANTLKSDQSSCAARIKAIQNLEILASADNIRALTALLHYCH